MVLRYLISSTSLAWHAVPVLCTWWQHLHLWQSSRYVLGCVGQHILGLSPRWLQQQSCL